MTHAAGQRVCPTNQKVGNVRVTSISLDASTAHKISSVTGCRTRNLDSVVFVRL